MSQNLYKVISYYYNNFCQKILSSVLGHIQKNFSFCADLKALSRHFDNILKKSYFLFCLFIFFAEICLGIAILQDIFVFLQKVLFILCKLISNNLQGFVFNARNVRTRDSKFLCHFLLCQSPFTINPVA